MKRPEIEEAVLHSIAETMNVALERLKPETSFADDLVAFVVAPLAE